MRKSIPCLYIVVPCYNEEEVLPLSSKLFINKIKELISDEMINKNSRVLFVNDGSGDNTWNIIKELSDKNDVVEGLALSRNFGHQRCLLAGLSEAKEKCDITISIDCDGQDDVNVMDDMVKAYLNGAEIVYGVRSKRNKDSLFKRITAQMYYGIQKKMGIETIYNHADYRLLSSKVIEELEKFKEVNVYLRGMVPLIGFNSTCVYFEREKRMAGKTHYPFRKMFSFAFDGVTSFSSKPIHCIVWMGIFVAFISFIGVIWSIAEALIGNTVPGWASATCIICFLGGIQLIGLSVIGEYIGKMYMEVKARPRFIIEERTEKAERTEK